MLILALLVGVAGLATFPLARRRATDLTRMVLDGIVLGGSILFVASVTLFPQILDTSDRERGRQLGGPGHRRGHRHRRDVTVPPRRSRGPAAARPGGAGFVCYAGSDFAYAVQYSSDGTYTFGSITDIGWIAGYALIALAAYSPGSQAARTAERPGEPSSVAGHGGHVQAVPRRGGAQPGQSGRAGR